ncbi:MAG: DNA-3-methyladenine glycosylase 2 family protein [Paracoccus sp. (in: a-proteobacteria)]|uniref:DNA-3-methyladenine glycosylase family protein n=1 Tax=Paracoccus sp. TaxID=267 RepID=UPI0026E065AD|nr:DNA-3-methyladenine glycosylase 2 family protein [Paracoccus sp. (in: a-proteobacteria)]MDO5632282.1 DNA-3-methyladenine glycosylase 2 family protein [Paracoccus sp. (in: a-proteobacteria)]
MRIIAAQADLDEGCDYLAAVCPVWARVLPQLGPLPLRRRADGFGAICDAVIGQQISVAAAAAITSRMQAAGLLDQAAVAAASEDDLRAAGLSRPKVRYLKGIAAADVDWPGLRDLPDDQAMAALVALPGVGHWTAEIYLKFALGRADVLASGDLALQESARLMYDLPARPSARALMALAEPWRPWRAVAARGLWAYYRMTKGREGVK